jgi:hypothetical protein
MRHTIAFTLTRENPEQKKRERKVTKIRKTTAAFS